MKTIDLICILILFYKREVGGSFLYLNKLRHLYKCVFSWEASSLDSLFSCTGLSRVHQVELHHLWLNFVANGKVLEVGQHLNELITGNTATTARVVIMVMMWVQVLIRHKIWGVSVTSVSKHLEYTRDSPQNWTRYCAVINPKEI